MSDARKTSLEPIPLFLDGRDVARVLEELEDVRTRLRSTIRYLTKCESPAGQRAHENAHRGLQTLERAIELARGGIGH